MNLNKSYKVLEIEVFLCFVFLFLVFMLIFVVGFVE